MDPILTGSLVSAGLNLGSSLITNLFNKHQMDEANEITKQNNQWQQQFAENERDWNRAQYIDEQKYNRELQNQIFEREDTAYQRTAEDLKNAGYSPLAINGTNNAGSVVGNSSHDTSASIPELSSINPFQAKNMDFGQFADILGQADSRAVQREANEIAEKRYLSEAEQKELDRQQKQEQFQAKMDSDQKNFNSQMEMLTSQFGEKNKNEQEKIKQKNKEIEILANQSKLSESQARDKAVQEAVYNLTGYHGAAKYVPDEDYDGMLEQWQNVLSGAYEKANKYLEEHAKSLSHGYNQGASGGNAAILNLSYQNAENGSESYEVAKIAQNIIEKELTDAAKRGIYYPLREYKK